MQSFLGFINFYAEYLQDATQFHCAIVRFNHRTLKHDVDQTLAAIRRFV